MNNSKDVVLIVDDDDEFTTYIRTEIQHQFPQFLVLLCNDGTCTRKQLDRYGQRIKAVVFDSGFGKNKLAGCELFLDLITERSWLQRRAVFHTAFDEEVHHKLVAARTLPEDRLIGKSIDSLTNLTHALHRMLS